MSKMVKMLRSLSILSIIFFCFTACSDDDDDKFEGTNEVFLQVKGEKTLIESEKKVLDVSIQLTRTLDKDVKLAFKFENKTDKQTGILAFVDHVVTVKAGEKTATLQVKSQEKNVLIQNTVFAIQLESSSDVNVKLNAPLELTVKPNPKVTPLTKAQQDLLAGYKAKGLDLTPWIGIIPVQVKVYFPGGGNVKAFTKKYERTINGKSVITLSKHATAETPALVMTENAMGLEEYIYEILKEETILNTEFWTPQPMPQKTIKLLNLSKDSKEEFGLSLDNLVLKQDKTIDFVSDKKAKDTYNDYIHAVGFEYKYSAWDRMKTLIAAKNQDAIDAAEGGGSVDPEVYLNNSQIKTNDWGEKNWVKASSSFDVKTGIMKFTFNFDHMNAADYIKVEVTYTSPKK